MKNILGLLIIYSLISCNRSERKIETYKFNGTKVVGEFLNGKKEGQHKHYDLYGNLVMIRNFVNDTLEGEIIQFWPNCSKSFSKMKKGKLLSNIAIEKDGDTIGIIIKDKAWFFEEGRIWEIVVYGKTRNDDRKIVFDSLGHLKEIKEPLDFLDQKDSLYLNKSYPDWKKQVKDWGNKK